MDEEAAKISPGSDGLLFCHMAGERSPIWDSNAQGTFSAFLTKRPGPILFAPTWRGWLFLLHNLETAKNWPLRWMF